MNLSNKLSWLSTTGYFLKKHYRVILGLGLIAAFGRVIQLNGFGKITPGLNIFLEVVVEFVRVLIFLYVLGFASFKKGALRIKHLFTHGSGRKFYFTVAIQKMKKQWLEISLNLFVFLGIAWTINYLIDALAYQTCLYLSLRRDGILAETSSEWAILLFFKNVSVIPLTLTFDAIFFLWIINKFKNHTNTSRSW